MSKFLYGDQLSAKLDTMLSQNCTCIVSFVGQGATKRLKKYKNKSARIVCNFQSNGTNPFEIEKLTRYLGKENVRQYKSFHAKVYACDSGAVVCSANLSTNGLELLSEPANQLEAGIFIGKDELAYKAILDWQDDIIKNSKVIEDWELQRRKENYSAVKGKVRKSNKQILTLSEVLQNKNQFAIAFCVNDSDVDEKKDRIFNSQKKKFDLSVSRYMEEQNLDDWTQEHYRASSPELQKTIKGISGKLLIFVDAKEDKLGLPNASRKMSLEKTMTYYNHYAEVKVTKTGGKAVLLFYKKPSATRYRITKEFESEFLQRIKDSLNDNYKRKLWINWLKTPSGEGWFMTIDQLKKLIRVD